MSYFTNMLKKGEDRSFEWCINSLNEVVVYRLDANRDRIDFCVDSDVKKMMANIMEHEMLGVFQEVINPDLLLDDSNKTWQDVIDALNTSKRKATLKKICRIFERIGIKLPFQYNWRTRKYYDPKVSSKSNISIPSKEVTYEIEKPKLTPDGFIA